MSYEHRQVSADSSFQPDSDIGSTQVTIDQMTGAREHECNSSVVIRRDEVAGVESQMGLPLSRDLPSVPRASIEMRELTVTNSCDTTCDALTVSIHPWDARIDPA